MQAKPDLVQAKHLDRPVEDDLVPIDGGAALGNRFTDIARADRSIELARVASLSEENPDVGEGSGESVLGRPPLAIAC